MNDVNKIFADIYTNNVWNGGSGPGSFIENAGSYIKTLTNFIKDHNIKSVLDYGCGDWQFSQYIPWSSITESYTGVDVVEFIIDHHKNTYAKDNVNFQLVNADWVWPTVDLTVCKDVLQHLPNNMVSALIENMKKHSKYVLLTNDVDGQDINSDCSAGGYRPLDFTKQPWSLDCEIVADLYCGEFHKQCILLKLNDT